MAVMNFIVGRGRTLPVPVRYPSYFRARTLAYPTRRVMPFWRPGTRVPVFLPGTRVPVIFFEVFPPYFMATKNEIWVELSYAESTSTMHKPPKPSLSCITSSRGRVIMQVLMGAKCTNRLRVWGRRFTLSRLEDCSAHFPTLFISDFGK